MSDTDTAEPSSPAIPATADVQVIPFKQLHAHPRNHRQIDESAPAFVEMVASMTTLGQLTPGIVRASPDGKGYQILAGHRRCRAAAAAKRQGFLARIIEADDATAFEVLLIENLQRVDLSPLEESEQVSDLLAMGRSAEQIAAKTGRSVRWIYLRAKLCDLSPAWRKAVTDPKHDAFGTPASWLELVARFEVKVQDEILTSFPDYCESEREFSKFIDEYALRKLSTAKWGRDDDSLVKNAGACSACPKRSSCQSTLFETKAKDDQCLDPVCWGEKEKAWLERRRLELQEKHPTLQRGTTEWDKAREDKKLVQIDTYSVITSQKPTPGAQPVLVEDGKQMGQVVWVKERPAHGGDSGGRSAGKKNVSDKEKRKLRLAQHQARQLKTAVAGLIRALGGDPEAGKYDEVEIKPSDVSEVKRPERATLVALAASVGVKHSWNIPALDEDSTWLDFAAHLKLTPANLDERLWFHIRAELIDKLRSEIITGPHDDGTGMALLSAAIGADWSDLIAKARDTQPLPKTLAAYFNEDGTPRDDLKGGKAEKAKTEEISAPKAKAKTKAKPKPKAAAAAKPKAKGKKGRAA